MGRQAIRASLPPYYQGPNDGNGYPNLLIHFYVHYLYVLSLKHFAFSLISSTYVYIYIFFYSGYPRRPVHGSEGFHIN